MKTFNKTLIAAALLTTGAAAQAEVSGGVAIASSYLWRGFDLSNGSAVVSGSLDYSSETGIYAGIWGSSGDDAYGTEYDLYVGFAGEAGDFGYDISYVDYNYPTNQGADDFDEIYLGLSYGDFGVSIYDGDGYTYTALSVGFGDFSMTYGDQSLIGDGADGSHVDLTYSMGDLGFTFSKAGGDAYGGADDLQFVVSYSLPMDM